MGHVGGDIKEPIWDVDEKQIHQFGWVDSLVDNCRKSCNHYKDQLMLKIWEKCLSLCHIAHFPTSSSILDLFDMCGNG